MKRVLLILCIFVMNCSVCFALNPEDLAGDYSLSSFELKYDGYPKVTSAQASSFSGRLSMTTKGFVADMSGSAMGQYVAQYFCGFYRTYDWSNTIYGSIEGGGPGGNLDASYSNGTLVTTGYNYDSDGDRYFLTCTWTKTQPYYTSGGYTQAQVDQAVASAVAEKEAIKDEIISQKDKTISALSDLDGDKKIDMTDILWGLQVLSEKK
jgi:hypothetical protein